MDGIHDLGGKHGFGQVVSQNYDAQELAFKERWHASVFAMTRALRAHGATHNTDQFRHAVERIDPVCYLQDGYYGRWLGAVETLLIEAGVVTAQQVSDVQAGLGAPSDRIAARPAHPPDVFEAPPSTQPTAARPQAADGNVAPAFSVGDSVVCRSTASLGHTRLPAYVRGMPGVIVAHHGPWVYPDTHAHGLGECPQHLYTVEFSGVALWGDTGEDDLSVCVDLFEPYLELLHE